MRPPEYYSQPDAPDPVLDAATVLRLARVHVPRVHAVTAVDETGGEARAYAIDDDVIFKTQRPQQLRPRTSLAKEVFFLQQLADVPGVAVPRVYGYGREGAIEYICMSRMPGVAIRYASLEPVQRLAALRDLGRVLRRIHAVDQAPFVDSALMPGDRSRDELVSRVRSQIQLAREAIEQARDGWRLERPFDTVAEQLLAAVPADVDLRALHSNPGPPHAFVDRTTGSYTGLIDFGDAYLGHPAFDLRTWPARGDRDTLLEGYRSDAPLSEDWLRAWRIVMALTELAVIATSPARRAEASEHLEQLLGTL